MGPNGSLFQTPAKLADGLGPGSDLGPASGGTLRPAPEALQGPRSPQTTLLRREVGSSAPPVHGTDGLGC